MTKHVNLDSLTTAVPTAVCIPASSELGFTGERVVPGETPENIFRESQMRYVFAGQFVRERTVVDVASGTGIGTQYLMKAGALSCWGFDMDLTSVQYAAGNYSQSGCKFAACDATNLSLANSSADVIVSFETIEHLPGPSLFLKECHRVLRPNGYLICSTPDRDFFRWGPVNPYHSSEMTPSEFVRKVRSVFPQCVLYEQGSINYPRYIAEMIARKRIVPFLERLGVKPILKSVLKKRPGLICREREFSGEHVHPEYEVRPYRRRWIRRSPYVLVVARKQSD
jgi:ubiquinone/menaquinone biosynthesis C-methylase UbiE